MKTNWQNLGPKAQNKNQDESSLASFLTQFSSVGSKFSGMVKDFSNSVQTEFNAASKLLVMGTKPGAQVPLSQMQSLANQTTSVAQPATKQSKQNIANLTTSGACTLESPAKNNFKFQDIVQEASQTHGVPTALINAVIKQESAFNPKAVSHAGAQGLMQLMPATGKAYGCKDPFDPRQNIMAGTKFLSELLDRYKGNVTLALAGYNAGPGNVAKYGNQVPPFKETQQYVLKVQNNYQANLKAAESKTELYAANQTPPNRG